MTAPEPFNRKLRRLHRDRAAANWSAHAFIQEMIAAELVDRLKDINREFSKALVLGYGDDELNDQLHAKNISVINADAGHCFAQKCEGVQCDEDRLPFRDGSFDLILSIGTLDTVNDLPGALTLIRRCLQPDGLFLAGFLGAGSLPRLRAAMREAEKRSTAIAPRMHPQVDIRAAGDLLGRAGFALQVADGISQSVRYSDFRKLLADLRGSANNSLLASPALSRSAYFAAVDAFQADAVDSANPEMVEIIYLTGWAPSDSQPQPAARGSGSVSLAAALKNKLKRAPE